MSSSLSKTPLQFQFQISHFTVHNHHKPPPSANSYCTPPAGLSFKSLRISQIERWVRLQSSSIYVYGPLLFRHNFPPNSFSFSYSYLNLDSQTNFNNNNSYQNLQVEEEQNHIHFHGLHNQDRFFHGGLGLPEKMEEENDHYHQLHHHREEKPTRPSRLGLRSTGGGGEIVEVQGGHIVRSTGRKDRHSKVCTAKGPRDRRVRLSAHTAIQFYDVQDRLGYDRPSKAVDWLIKKAKASIDELAELPAWKPTAGLTPVMNLEQNPNNENLNRHRLGQLEEHPDEDIVDTQMGNGQNSSFLPTSLDSIKSFFPAGGSSTPPVSNNSSGMQFPHNFPPSELSQNLQNQDLKLSLQSFQDPIPHHQGNHTNNIYFDGSNWPDSGGFSGFVFNSPPTQTTPFLQPLFGQPTNNQLFNYIPQRGPLQSSNTPPVRAWVDPPPPFSGGAVDQHPTLAFHHQASMPGFASGFGFSRFHIPAGIHGDEEEHDGISDKPSSASSDSHH